MRNPCCFNCGGPHYKRECKKPLRGMTLTCPHQHCKQEIVLSSRGQTVPQVVVAPQQSNAQLAPSGSSIRLPSAPTHVGNLRKRAAASEVVGRPPAKHRRTGKEVSICGKRYTSLSWFLNTPNPPPKKCERARHVCADRAIELRGGHVRALDAARFAISPSALAQPPPLLGARRNLSTDWIDTEVTDIQVRRAQQPLKARLSQVLRLVADLERTL